MRFSAVCMTLSHIQGILSKTIKLMEDGIKPVFVFEGKPPEMKQNEVCFVAPLSPSSNGASSCARRRRRT